MRKTHHYVIDFAGKLTIAQMLKELPLFFSLVGKFFARMLCVPLSVIIYYGVLVEILKKERKVVYSLFL